MTLKVLQTAFTTEGEDYDRVSPSPLTATDSDYSNGEAIRFADGGRRYEWDFTLEYTIPEGEFEIYYRNRGAGTDVPPLDWYVDDDHVGFTNNPIGLGWSGVFNSSTTDDTLPELPPGEYTIAAEAQNGDFDDQRDIDAIAPLDDRYGYDFPDTLNNDGVLNGPQWYPDAVEIETSQHDDTWNVESATLTVSMNDTSGQQTIAVSNTDGTTYALQAPNAESVSGSLDTPGSLVRGKAVLSRYGTQNQTPATGISGQTLTEWELSITTSDLAVIDGPIELVGSHYGNLQELHSRANMRFVMDYQPDALLVESFERGAVVEDADWITEDVQRDPDYAEYANVQTVYGAEVDVESEDGDETTTERLVVTARSETAIAEDGEEIPASPAFEPKLDSRGDLKSLARTLLSERLAAGDLQGSVDIAPKAIRPGYSYVVDELDGETLPLERVSFREGVDGAQGQLTFGDVDDLAARLSGISSDVKSVKDAF